MHYVVAYDITSDFRRRKVLHLLKNYGIRVQFSVVECELDRKRLDRLKHELTTLINPREDRLHLYPLCDNCYFQAESLGSELPCAGDY